MSSSDKCCFFIKMNTGCVLLGFFNFIISAVLTAASVAYIALDRDVTKHQGNPVFYIHLFLHGYLNNLSIDIILWIGVCVGVTSMMSSGLLIAGITKSKSGLVLSYFVFGIFFTIAGILSGLLLMLKTYWVASLIFFLVSIINIHFLVVVHTVYDSMLRGKEFDFSPHERLEEESTIQMQ